MPRFVFVNRNANGPDVVADDELIDDVGELIVGAYWNTNQFDYPAKMSDPDHPNQLRPLWWRSLQDVKDALGNGARIYESATRPDTLAQEGGFRLLNDDGSIRGYAFNIKLSGLMNYKNPANLHGAKGAIETILNLNEDFHDSARNADRLPPILCLDQEGGTNTGMAALHDYFPQGPRELVGHVAILGSDRGHDTIRSEEDVSKGKQIVEEQVRCASEVLALSGFTVNLAPLGDLVDPGDFLDLQGRGFSADPQIVTEMCGAFVLGSRRAGLAPCPKHLPGHNTQANSHYGLPILHESLDTIFEENLAPFKASQEQGAGIFLVGHLFYKNLYSSSAEYNTVTQSPTALRALIDTGMGGHAGLGLEFDSETRPIMMTDDIEIMFPVHYQYGAFSTTADIGSDVTGTDKTSAGWSGSVPSSDDAFDALVDGAATRPIPGRELHTGLKDLAEVIEGINVAEFDLILTQGSWVEAFVELVRLGASDTNDATDGPRERIRRAANRVRHFKKTHLDPHWHKPGNFIQRAKVLKWSQDGAEVGELASHIDYRRIGALPYLVPPRPAFLKLSTFLTYPSDTDTPCKVAITKHGLDRDPSDVGDPSAMEWESLLAPRNSQVFFQALPGAAAPTDVQVALAPTSAASEGADYATSQTEAVLWKTSRSPLPIPLVPPDSVILRWNDTSRPANAMGASLAAAHTAPLYSGATRMESYVLATDHTAGDGELDPLWLRAMFTGTMRFEHYEHFDKIGSVWVPGPRSNAGRLLFESAHPKLKSLLKSYRFGLPSSAVIEHVDAHTIADAWVPLLWHQLVHFYDLATKEITTGDIAFTRGALEKSIGLLAQCFAAWREITTQQTLGDLAAAKALASTPATTDSVKGAIDALLAPAYVDSIEAFLRNHYVPALMGRQWTHTGIPMITPSQRGASAVGSAYDVLDDFRFHRTERSILVFAGCPVGRPALVYSFAGVTQDASTFDAELVALRDARGTKSLSDMRRDGDFPSLAPAPSGMIVPGTPSVAVRVLAPGSSPSDTASWFGDFLGSNTASPFVPMVNSRAARLAGHSIHEVWTGLTTPS